MPRLPEVVGSWARSMRPTSVVSEGLAMILPSKV